MADGPFGSNLKREHYTSNKEARIIQLSNIGESGWREDNTKYTTFVHAETISRSIVSPGNLVIAKMMPAGRAIICPDVEKMYVLSSDAVKYVPSKEIFNKYLLYAINSPVVLNQIHAEVQGVTRARTSIEKLRGYLVPIPPKEEQCRIVNSIDYWLEIIGTIEQNQSFVSAATERIKARILEYAIEGKLVPQNPMDEPAIELLRRINPSFQPSHNLHYDPQKLFSLPRGWEWCSVKAYTKKVTDYVASGSFASLKENVRYYKQPNYAILVKTKDFANNFTEDLTYTDEQGYAFLENSRLCGGELLFSNVGSVGKIFKVPKLNMRMTLAPNAIMVKFHQDEHSAWFERVFQSPFGQESLRIIASATAIMKFNKTDFGKLLIPVPPVSEQKRILKVVDAMLAQLDCIYNME